MYAIYSYASCALQTSRGTNHTAVSVTDLHRSWAQLLYYKQWIITGDIKQHKGGILLY